MKLAISLIRRDGGTQPRAALDYTVVQSYSEDMIAGAAFPPVVVYHDGETYWLADGFHRVLAAERGHFDEVEAEVRAGTREDAIDYACSSIPNSKHGLRENPEDRHRRIETMIRRKAGWSNRQIAEWCGVDEKTVRKVKGESTADIPQSATVTGRDGRTINTANIGKTRAPDPVVNEMDMDDEEPEESEEPPRHAEPMYGSNVADALRLDIVHIESRLIILPDLIERHEYVNGLLKFLKQKAAEFNQSSQGVA